MEAILDLANWQTLLVIGVGIAMAIVAFKIKVSFDVNKWLERRRQAKIHHAQGICPHAYLKITGVHNGEVEYVVTPMLVSPPGTTAWKCRQCHTWMHIDEAEIARQNDYWGNNPSELRKRLKEFEKLAWQTH